MKMTVRVENMFKFKFEEFWLELIRLETEGKEYEVLCGRADVKREGEKITAVARSDVVVFRVDDRYYVYFYKWYGWRRGWKPKHSDRLTLTVHKCKNGLCGERIRVIYGDAKIIDDFAWATEAIRYYYVTIIPESESVIVELEFYDAETHPKYVRYDYYVYCRGTWLAL